MVYGGQCYKSKLNILITIACWDTVHLTKTVDLSEIKSSGTGTQFIFGDKADVSHHKDIFTQNMFPNKTVKCIQA